MPFGYNFKRVLRILGVAGFIERVLALKISDIDDSNVNLWQSLILKGIFFVILLNRGGVFGVLSKIFDVFFGGCLGGNWDVVSFFTVSKRGNEEKTI